MSVVLLRSLILYILVIAAVRLMGKRQLGELQPSELVITILVSNIATLPIENTDIPLIVGVTPILALVCFEVIVSWLNLRHPKLRRVISGTPKIIISDGRIDPDVMRSLRFSVDDLMMALRGSDIFDIADVQLAMVETTGSISVMKKRSTDTPERRDLGILCEDSDPPYVVISDGVVIDNAVMTLGLSESVLQKILGDNGLRAEEVFIMTADSGGSFFIADKKGHQPLCITLDKEGKNEKS